METLPNMREHMQPVRSFVESFEEPPNLKLLDSLLTVEATTTEGEDVIYTAHLHPSGLDPAQFHELLRAVAPAGLGTSAKAINEDWELPNRHSATRLLELHSHLGTAWEVFMASRRTFMRVMADNTNLEDWRYKIVRGASQNILIPEHKVDVSKLVTAALADTVEGPHLLEPLVEVGINDPRHLILEGVKVALNQDRNGREQLRGERSILRQFRLLSTSSKEKVLAELPNYVSNDSGTSFLEMARFALFDSFKAEDGNRYYVPKSDIEGSLVEQASQTEVVREGKYEAKVFKLRHIFLRLSRWYTQKLIMMPGSIEQTEPTSTIRPHIRWSKSPRGEREFILEEPVEKSNGQYEDSVLGVLVVAYFTPEVRQKWPNAMSVKGSRIKQPIQEAQVPVLALMPGVQRSLLNSRFITEAEKLAA